MSATSTARRYGPDYGPVVFGCAGNPPLDVRWNKLTGALVIEVRGNPSASCLVDRAVAPAVLVGLAAAHRRGRMWEAVRDILDPFRERPAWLEAASDFYRCGRLLLEIPAHQQIERKAA